MDNDELARALGRIEGHQAEVSRNLAGINSHLAKLNNRTASLERFKARLLGATALGIVVIGVTGTLLTDWFKHIGRS